MAVGLEECWDVFLLPHSRGSASARKEITDFHSPAVAPLPGELNNPPAATPRASPAPFPRPPRKCLDSTGVLGRKWVLRGGRLPPERARPQPPYAPSFSCRAACCKQHGKSQASRGRGRGIQRIGDSLELLGGCWVASGGGCWVSAGVSRGEAGSETHAHYSLKRPAVARRCPALARDCRRQARRAQRAGAAKRVPIIQPHTDNLCNAVDMV